MKPSTKPKASPGRPPSLSGGKRVNVYLDADSLKAADKLGGGNVSEGIRMALKPMRAGYVKR